MIGLVDIGGTKTLAAVADSRDAAPRALLKRPTAADGAAASLIAMLDEVRDGERLDAIAMAVPGPFDRENARLINPPGMTRAWWDLDLRAEIGDRFGCPVIIENDANCAALAEAGDGAGRGHRTVVYFTVSTDIGTGVVRDGELVISRHDNEGGHMVLWPRWLGGPSCGCGGAGCLAVLASGRSIERRFGAPAERLDDPEAWDEIGRWLGLAVVNATALIDCDAVVFGGGVCNRWDSFAASLVRTVGESLFLQPAPAILRAALGEDRNLYGALRLLRASERSFSAP